MMTIAMIYLGDENHPKCTGLLKLLSTLFSDTNSQQKKREVLKEFDVNITENMEDEVSEMCDYSSYIEERGIEKGRIEGRMEGRSEGMLNTYFGLIDDNILTIEQAAERAKMQLEEFEKAYHVYLEEKKKPEC